MLYTDDYPVLNDVIDLYGTQIWDEENLYPIWNEEKREWLNGCITEHFRFRRIAQDTGTLFSFYLNRRMREMMPTINPIFQALENEKLDATSSYSTTDTSEGSDTSKSRQLYSATPQVQLSGEESYATNLTDNDSEGSNQATSTHEGRQGNVASALTEWVQGVNNALYIVYNGLEPLFMQLYDKEGY